MTGNKNGNKNSEARLRANEKYRSKTYKHFKLQLRKDDDADIIASIENAKKNGQSIRNWLLENVEVSDDEFK